MFTLKPPYPYRIVGLLPFGVTSLAWMMNIEIFVPSFDGKNTCSVVSFDGSTGIFTRAYSSILPVLIDSL